MTETREGAGRGPSSRHIPNAVKREVWRRDRRQCAFVSADGRRCGERAFLELHHVHPYSLDGAATVDNIALRCRSHNQYESEMIFGPYRGAHVQEVEEDYTAARSLEPVVGFSRRAGK
jgi:5-methylcytosine-specific restriction endonuclease McrA